MTNRILAVFLALAFSSQAFAGIIDATALSEPKGDGQWVSAVLLEYDQEMPGKGSISANDFTVAGRTVIRAEPVAPCPQHTVPYCAAKSSHLVLLRLAPSDNAAVTEHSGREPSVEREIELAITQKAPAASIKTTKVRHLVAEDFTQHIFKDPASGISVPYNLFVPKEYNPKKAYPLVMFIHDAGSTNSNVKNTLYQGNGATVWATPEAQAKHEAFVLAPQFDHKIVNDNSDDPEDLDPTINLINALCGQYSLDGNRLYTTGQSGGAMMSLAMNIKYPDFFAASYLVAGQWAPEKTPPIAKNNLFILVSENDRTAFPAEQAIVAILAENGGVVKESFGWNGSAPMAELNQKVRELLTQGGNIHFAAFQGGTLPMEKAQPERNGTAHMGTWQVAYDIDAIRDWLLEQRKNEAK